MAARQHGVVTRAQLLAAGLMPDAVDHRLSVGRLRPLHQGVYLLGPILAPLAREMAALLACGPGAVLSHRTAAALWELLPRDASIVEVSIPQNRRTTRPSVRAHAVQMLPADEVTRRHGLPVTAAGRTVLDLAGAAGSRELERALAHALRSGLTNSAELRALIARYRRRRGNGRLLRALGGADPAFTRSRAEDLFLALIRKARLAAPETNVQVAGHEVDFFWPAERFVVEIDGFAFHSSSEKFETDRSRDAELAAAGIRVIRVTWRQLVNEPEALLVRLSQALARTGIEIAKPPTAKHRLASSR